jgi:hypothetical protein
VNSLSGRFLIAPVLLHAVVREREFHIEYRIRSKSRREVNILYGHQISVCYRGDYVNRFLLGSED